MSDLYIYTIFEKDGGRPRCTGIKAGDRVQIYDLYRPGARKLIGVINQHKALIRDLIVKASHKGLRIVTSDFKNHIRAFELPLERRVYNVYDLHMPDFKPLDSPTRDAELLKKLLEKMSKHRLKDYHKVYANAAVVYQDLENRGLINNFEQVKPIWSQKTFAGRSKTTGFNVQGFTDHHRLMPPGAGDKDVLVHFDWISADIRVASILSGDKTLQEAFDASDPYVYMMEHINAQSHNKINRDECKVLLLKAINSMDFTSVAFQIYPVLGEWINRCRKQTADNGGCLETILGRRFRMAHAKNQLAVLNGAMQGSVAHGMQNILRRVWERMGNRIVADVHDSLVVSSPPEPNEVRATIAVVAPLMLRPFEGLLPDNPAFPLKVRFGKKWRKWKMVAIYRQSGVEYVKPGSVEEDGEGPEEGELESQMSPTEGPEQEEIIASQTAAED
jgi:hypothetical protein